MAQCPSCQAEIHDDFGLVECPQCQMAVFIDMDGNAQVQTPENIDDASEDIESPAVSKNTKTYLENELIDEVNENSYENEKSFETPENLDDSENQHAPWLNSDDVFQDDGKDVSESAEPVGQNEPPFEHDMDEDPEFKADAAPTQTPDEIDPSPHPTDGQNALSEISDYGNSEESLAREGNILVTVQIQDIDSPELRASVLENLSDEKFQWNVNELDQSISKGELILERISQLKAAIIIQRIKHLPLKIKWEQYRINE